MRQRRKNNIDLGDAISMEDAISMMTIVFVLFVIFLVPLVSIDKAQLERKKMDNIWKVAIDNNNLPKDNDLVAQRYVDAFEIDEEKWITESKIGNKRVIEALGVDSTLYVICHNLDNNRFDEMIITTNGETITYRHGILDKIRSSSNWFIVDDSYDYGDKKSSKEFYNWYKKLCQRRSK